MKASSEMAGMGTLNKPKDHSNTTQKAPTEHKIKIKPTIWTVTEASVLEKSHSKEI